MQTAGAATVITTTITMTTSKTTAAMMIARWLTVSHTFGIGEMGMLDLQQVVQLYH